MKKLFLLLIPITLITLCGCSYKLYKGTVILRHEADGFGDATYIVAQLEDGIRVSARSLELMVGDNVICSIGRVIESKCYLQ